MKLANKTADIFVPGGGDIAEALSRTTHMGIGAHQDDLEFMAFHGIAECFGRPDRSFCGVVCTNGAGSPRAGVYADYTDERMRAVRRSEQRTAASVGRYGAMIQLDHSSAVVKDPANPLVKADLTEVLRMAKPASVYTHNPADKHDTHVAVMGHTIAALRSLAGEYRPERVLGCEVWRGLDWMPDRRKVVLNETGRDSLAASLSGVFDSQIAGGKRYDLAIMGRRRANATFFESHGVDQAEMLMFAVDLKPLLDDPALSVSAYVDGLIGEFRAEVREKLTRWK
jgi:LmbE family N-acetylglucosaminyl deacetylase